MYGFLIAWLIGTTDSKQQALHKTTDVDTYTLDFEDNFELEKEQMIGALIYSIHKVEKTKNYNNQFKDILDNEFKNKPLMPEDNVKDTNKINEA